MKTAILEKIFSILADNGIKIRIDADNDIIIDTNRVRVFQGKKRYVNYTWKSVDDFLFKSCPNNRKASVEFSNGKFYCNYCMFNIFQKFDEAYCISKLYQRSDGTESHKCDKLLMQFHNAFEILKHIQGNSLEEIAIKLDLLGI